MRTGHWIDNPYDKDFSQCSKCGSNWEKGIVENCNMDYCPNCGERMVETQESEVRNMSYKSEFPDYDGEFYLPDGWIDNSWHNDTMPRASLTNGNIEYNLWQDYVDKDKRENTWSDKRYAFAIEVNGNTVFWYETNKLSKIKKLVKGVCL